MSDIYVFGPNDDDNDYSSFGLVGAILPTEATFNEAGNGDSSDPACLTGAVWRADHAAHEPYGLPGSRQRQDAA